MGGTVMKTTNRPPRISDILCVIRAHVLAVDENGTLWMWKPPGDTKRHSDHVAAMRAATCRYQEIQWQLSNLPITANEIFEAQLETKSLLRNYREHSRFAEFVR
jgi:hypothetical protein